MELYYLRHAIAEEPMTSRVENDSERPLTDEGIKKMKKAALGMKNLGLSFDKIVSSPYLRAKHTAEIAAQGVEFAGKIRFSDTLTPGADFKSFAKLLKEFAANEKILVVGHQPSIGEFVSELISGQKDTLLDFKKGSLCRIDITDSSQEVRGYLKWLLTSKFLRQNA